MHIEGSDQQSLYLSRKGTLSNGDIFGAVYFGNPDSLKTRLASIDAHRESATDDSYLTFKTMESGTSGTSERLRITSKGAFGLNGTNYGTVGQVLASQGPNAAPQWVNTATGNLTTIKVKQDNYCGVDDSSLNPISVTPTSAGISTIGIGTTSNAYGRRFVQDNDPTTPAGGSYTACDGDIWYDTST